MSSNWDWNLKQIVDLNNRIYCRVIVCSPSFLPKQILFIIGLNSFQTASINFVCSSIQFHFVVCCINQVRLFNDWNHVRNFAIDNNYLSISISIKENITLWAADPGQPHLLRAISNQPIPWLEWKLAVSIDAFNIWSFIDFIWFDWAGI